MKFIISCAKEITLFCDSSALLYLRLCKNSNFTLMRFSLAISMYPITVRHIPSGLNSLSDCYSRSRFPADHSKLMTANYMALTTLEANEILKGIMIPEDFAIRPETLKKLLTHDSIPSPFKDKNKKKKGWGL